MTVAEVVGGFNDASSHAAHRIITWIVCIMGSKATPSHFDHSR